MDVSTVASQPGRFRCRLVLRGNRCSVGSAVHEQCLGQWYLRGCDESGRVNVIGRGCGALERILALITTVPPECAYPAARGMSGMRGSVPLGIYAGR